MTTSPRQAPTGERTRNLVARMDRIDVWSLSYAFIAIVGLGFLFTFYDVFDINVSFIQTCTAIKAGCTPATAFNDLKLPVVLNLAGYVVGTLTLSPISDRIGRRNMLLITMVITGLGSLYNAFVPDYANFNAARFITGIGIGADLAVVNTYIGEVAPRRGRARFTSLIFIMSALGAFIAVWLGLVLTTPAAPWPHGLPATLAGPGFSAGWRYMYGVGALLALVAVVLRIELPESPRWLLRRGRLAEAEQVVTRMETTARRRLGELAPVRDEEIATELQPGSESTYQAYREIFGNRRYVGRVALLLAVWFIGYITVYAFAAGFTSLLTSLHYPPPEAGVIVAVGVVGFIACAVVSTFITERLERKLWLPISAALTMIGGVVTALGGHNLIVAFIGSAIIFFGFNFWVSPTYAWSAENFPTRARATGFALVDGIGHIGGGIGVLAIASYVVHLSLLEALLLIGGFLCVSAIIAQAGIATRHRRLEEVSP
ncbi:MAG TPA: MFS transporter [Acidimicrobiales bacterium]|nr:MFS transporter [Acidimicrobiales bacterium]